MRLFDDASRLDQDGPRPMCPICEGPMTNRNGDPLLECARFPSCEGVRPAPLEGPLLDVDELGFPPVEMHLAIAARIERAAAAHGQDSVAVRPLVLGGAIFADTIDHVRRWRQLVVRARANGLAYLVPAALPAGDAYNQPTRDAPPKRTRAGDSFLDLCRASLREGEPLCWNLRCRTCGAHDLRLGLEALTVGADFRLFSWSAGSRHSASWHEFALDAVAHAEQLTSNGTAWTLSAIGATTPLAPIASIVGFPDWLGYLGVLLQLVERHPPSVQRLQEAWVPQLTAMGGNATWWRRFLSDDALLSWRDLDRAEAEDLGRNLAEVVRAGHNPHPLG